MTYHPLQWESGHPTLGVSPKLTSHLRDFNVANLRDLLRVQAQGTSGCRDEVRSTENRETVPCECIIRMPLEHAC